MPLDLTYTNQARFEVRASGEITLAEVEGCIAELLAHPGLTGGPDVLVVADDVEQVLTTSELRIVARGMGPILKRGLGALAIVTRNPLAYGMARIFAVFAETMGAEVAAFHEAPEASRWLAANRRKVSAPET